MYNTNDIATIMQINNFISENAFIMFINSKEELLKEKKVYYKDAGQACLAILVNLWIIYLLLMFT